MNHDIDHVQHEPEKGKNCQFQHQYENKVYLCKVILNFSLSLFLYSFPLLPLYLHTNKELQMLICHIYFSRNYFGHISLWLFLVIWFFPLMFSNRFLEFIIYLIKFFKVMWLLLLSFKGKILKNWKKMKMMAIHIWWSILIFTLCLHIYNT